MTRDGPLGLALGAIAVGAILGAWIRWGLSYWFNPRVASLPLGTLAANLIGGYLVGLAVAVFVSHPAIGPAWRLFVVTGFLGGLTTFSAFSAENVALLQTGQWGAAVLHVVAHVVGSLLATMAGIASIRLFSA